MSRTRTAAPAQSTTATPPDVEQLARNCESAGVILAAGTEWFPAEAAGPFIRLNYAGPNPGAFPEGTRVLGQELSRILG